MPTKPVSGRPNGNISDYLASNGVVTAHREFDPYGNPTAATGPLVNDFNFWFSSKYLDQETGLYYYGFRYFQPETGRWVSRDPLRESSALIKWRFDPTVSYWYSENLYSFLGNDGVAEIDYLGRVFVSASG
jgi:RHS repeat-associated protein